MKGGPTKMSEIAKRRIIAQEGINYQPTEEAEQTAVIEWATIMEKQFPELALLHHCPNGEARNPIIGAKLKRMGVKAGVPDLFLPVPRGGFHGLWIEMKRRKGGRVSEGQDW